MQKSVILTNEQLHRFNARVLKEAFAVNMALVNDVRDYLKGFKNCKYDDLNDDGDVIQKFCVQQLSTNGEPLQTISLEKLIDKTDSRMREKIKNDKDRHEFITRLINDDWLKGKMDKSNYFPSFNSVGY